MPISSYSYELREVEKGLENILILIADISPSAIEIMQVSSCDPIIWLYSDKPCAPQRSDRAWNLG